VEALVTAKGPNSFYESLENRQECCHIRKVEPLGRALAGKAAWITGLRRDQAPSRTGLAVFESDESNGLIKVNPLADWTLEQVLEYVKVRHVPHNPLHALGYPTLGCAPCTRAVAPGEDIRAGRWWWEQSGHKECGLHGPRVEP
jgi:phosphoadenosine phosphosulfate reductase